MPLDVANRGACDDNVVASACELTLPMRSIWFAVYIMMALWIGVVIPFCLFYYEADSEMSVLGRLASGAQWTVMILIVSALVLGLGYGLAGYVDYPVQPLYSGLDDLSSLPSLQLDPDTGALRELPGVVPAACSPHATRGPRDAAGNHR